MTITNIISAIGNNKSIYPLLLRDCAIEVPSKIYITRKENLKDSKVKANDATREKIIDEYATSAIWLGGIPAVEQVVDKFIRKKGFSPNVNVKLYKEEKFQGLNYNIKKFKKLAPDVVKELEKVRANKKLYETFNAGKFIAATSIPIAIMGFVLPKLNFALTKNIKDKRKNNSVQNAQVSDVIAEEKKSINSFSGNSLSIPSFGGGFVSSVANLKTVDKMAITDGGLTVGRVSTSRNRDEAFVNGFRMLGSMFLNFVAPKYIAKFLDKSANKLFNINVNLDPLFMEDKKFINAIKSGKVELPKSGREEDLFEFIDSKPDSFFCKFAQKSEKLSYLSEGVRDPRKYVDVKDLANFRDELEAFVKNAKTSGDVDKFAKKAKYVKGGNILANVAISSFLLAVMLPKIQYGFNKLVTGSYSDPGLKD